MNICLKQFIQYVCNDKMRIFLFFNNMFSSAHKLCSHYVTNVYVYRISQMTISSSVYSVFSWLQLDLLLVAMQTNMIY